MLQRFYGICVAAYIGSVNSQFSVGCNRNTFLFGYFLRDITRSIWMMFRSVELRDIAPSSISIQASTLNSLYLQTTVTMPPITLHHMPRLRTVRLRLSSEVTLHPKTSNLRSLHIHCRYGNTLSATSSPVCDISTMLKLTRLSVDTHYREDYRPIVFSLGFTMCPLENLTWWDDVSDNGCFWVIVRACRLTLKGIDCNIGGGLTTIDASTKLSTCGSFPNLVEFYWLFQPIYVYLMRTIGACSIEQDKVWVDLQATFPASWVIPNVHKKLARHHSENRGGTGTA